MVGRSCSARALGGALLSLGVLLSTAACGGNSSFADAASSSTTARTTSSAPTTTSSPATTTSSTTSTSSTSASTSGSSTTTLGTDDSGRTLTLADFFMPTSDWQEKRYDIADQSQKQGIGATISSCSYSEELELRLANNFDQLTFSVGQGNDSPASDQSVSVEVLANNAQVEIRSVPFNQIQQFTIPVSGVNALKIDLSLDSSVAHCGRGAVIGVLTDIKLQ